jgi:radical SAM protein with 4Fe4S-binding SPASM domain
MKFVHVSITYKCNKDCSYCYVKGINNDYDDMGINDFKLLLKWFIKNKINKFNITGGECTKHPLFKEFLSIALKKKFKIGIFSNGLFSHNLVHNMVGISSILINYNLKNHYTKKEYEILHRNLKELNNNKIPLLLSFNITNEIQSSNHIIKLLKKYKIKKINVNLTYPNSFKYNTFANQETVDNKELSLLIKLVNEIKQTGIPVRISRPVPYCILKNEKLEFFSQCMPGSNIVSINPDLTIFPCLGLFFKGGKITNFQNIKSISNYYFKVISELKWKHYLYPECHSCIWRIRKKCQGGCLAQKCTPFIIIDKEQFIIYSQFNNKKTGFFIDIIDRIISSLNKKLNKNLKIKIFLFKNKNDMKYYSGNHNVLELPDEFIKGGIYYQYKLKSSEDKIKTLISKLY